MTSTCGIAETARIERLKMVTAESPRETVESNYLAYEAIVCDARDCATEDSYALFANVLEQKQSFTLSAFARYKAVTGRMWFHSERCTASKDFGVSEYSDEIKTQSQLFRFMRGRLQVQFEKDAESYYAMRLIQFTSDRLNFNKDLLSETLGSPVMLALWQRAPHVVVRVMRHAARNCKDSLSDKEWPYANAIVAYYLLIKATWDARATGREPVAADFKAVLDRFGPFYPEGIEVAIESFVLTSMVTGQIQFMTDELLAYLRTISLRHMWGAAFVNSRKEARLENHLRYYDISALSVAQDPSVGVVATSAIYTAELKRRKMAFDKSLREYLTAIVLDIVYSKYYPSIMIYSNYYPPKEEVEQLAELPIITAAWSEFPALTLDAFRVAVDHTGGSAGATRRPGENVILILYEFLKSGVDGKTDEYRKYLDLFDPPESIPGMADAVNIFATMMFETLHYKGFQYFTPERLEYFLKLGMKKSLAEKIIKMQNFQDAERKGKK